MRKYFTLLLLILFVSITSGAKNGWVRLFNGKNLDGWNVVNGKASYQIIDKEIVGTSVINSPNSFLATTKNYGDFILEYEMKMESGLNSGVQIRSISDPKIKDGRVQGYQVECDDSESAGSGGIYDEARRGWLYPMEYNNSAKSAYKKGEWNKYRVECVGNSIRTWLNGVPCANLVDDMTPEGFIALQVHGIGKNKEVEGRTIRWRNIRIMTTNLAAERKKMENVEEVSYLSNTLTEAEQRAGWKLLWEGKNLDQWVTAKEGVTPVKGWTMLDNELVANLAGNKGGGDIVTKKEYKNFIWEVDFIFTPGANGGIKYFIQPSPAGKGFSTVGCEYQILDDDKHPDAKMGINGNRTLASLYDLIPANSQKFDPVQAVKRSNGVNQWNRARIEVRGNKVTHYLNGIKIVEYTRGTPDWRAVVATSKFSKVKGFGEYQTGHLLIQDHGDEVHYRSIKVLELKD